MSRHLTNRQYRNRNRRLREALDLAQNYHKIVRDIRKLTSARDDEPTLEAVKRIMGNAKAD